MTEEEYFRKNFPDSCYGNKPLSPHWDYFQYGVEFGERQSEDKIKDLERKLEQTEKDLADYQFNYPTIKELEKENTELKEYNKYLRRKRQGGIQKQYNKVAIIKQQDDQLTKAKEIIKIFLKYEICTLNIKDELADNIAKAEAFLNSEVEK